MVESAKVTGIRSVSAFSVAMPNANPLRVYRKVSIKTLLSYEKLMQPSMPSCQGFEIYREFRARESDGSARANGWADNPGIVRKMAGNGDARSRGGRELKRKRRADQPAACPPCNSLRTPMARTFPAGS